MRHVIRFSRPGLVVLALCATALSPARGEEPTKRGGWTITQDDQGVRLHTMELTLHPQPEPKPALKHRLVPDEFDMVDGNAAVYYLKAMGFLEQNHARDRISEMLREAARQAQEEGIDFSDLPPYKWLAMTPAELPLHEVKEYLQLTSFQPGLLREAARRRQMDLDRQIRDVDNPMAYLLPEIQSMRELARTQSLRCKVALAEGRVEDAIAILGQQYSMARHLGQDEFFVSNLVGIACAGIAWEDALYLVQHPQAPNLYWAFASLPDSMFDLARSSGFERQFLYEQIKVLREVDETPRPAGYWQDFIDQLTADYARFGVDFGLGEETVHLLQDRVTARALVTGYIVAAYPAATRFLIDECGMSAEQVAAYPTAQAAFLAVVRYYDRARDDVFKWTFVPSWQVQANSTARRRDDDLRRQAEEFGWIAVPAWWVLPAMTAARTAADRFDQLTALIQTVEAIRMYGAVNEGKLPPTLDDLPVPAPVEPFTGAPLAYEFRGDSAVLTGHPLPGVQYRLVLRFAQ